MADYIPGNTNPTRRSLEKSLWSPISSANTACHRSRLGSGITRWHKQKKKDQAKSCSQSLVRCRFTPTYLTIQPALRITPAGIPQTRVSMETSWGKLVSAKGPVSTMVHRCFDSLDHMGSLHKDPSSASSLSEVRVGAEQGRDPLSPPKRSHPQSERTWAPGGSKCVDAVTSLGTQRPKLATGEFGEMNGTDPFQILALVHCDVSGPY